MTIMLFVFGTIVQKIVRAPELFVAEQNIQVQQDAAPINEAFDGKEILVHEPVPR